MADPCDLQERGCQRGDQFPDRGFQSANTLVQPVYLRDHLDQHPADVIAHVRGVHHRRQRGHAGPAGEVARGVVEPEVRVCLDLADHHGAEPDEVGPSVDQNAELASHQARSRPFRRDPKPSLHRDDRRPTGLETTHSEADQRT